MKRKIIIDAIIGTQESAIIVIDKNGMRVEEKSKSYRNDDYFYGSFIRQCVDMDEWRHSRHVSIDKAMIKGSSERQGCHEIMKGKIAQREADIQFLKDGIQILGRCK